MCPTLHDAASGGGVIDRAHQQPVPPLPPDRFPGSEERCEASPDVVQAGAQIVQNLVRVLAGCLALVPAEGNLRDDPGGDEPGNGLTEHDLEDRLIVAVSGYLANRLVLAIEGRGRMVRGINAEAEDTRDHGG